MRCCARSVPRVSRFIITLCGCGLNRSAAVAFPMRSARNSTRLGGAAWPRANFTKMNCSSRWCVGLFRAAPVWPSGSHGASDGPPRAPRLMPSAPARSARSRQLATSSSPHLQAMRRGCCRLTIRRMALALKCLSFCQRYITPICLRCGCLRATRVTICLIGGSASGRTRSNWAHPADCRAVSARCFRSRTIPISPRRACLTTCFGCRSRWSSRKVSPSLIVGRRLPG